MIGYILIGVLFVLFLRKQDVMLSAICAFSLQLVMLRGIGVHSVYEALCLLMPIAYFIKSLNRANLSTYPLWIPTILYIVSYLATGYHFNNTNWTIVIFDIGHILMFPILLWCGLQTRQQYQIFTKFTVYIFVVISIYGFIEAVTGLNPFATWMVNSDLFTGWRDESTFVRFGIKRIQSLMIYRDTLGVSSSLVFVYLFYLKKNCPSFIAEMKLHTLVNYLLVALPISVFLTGTRACIACLVICFLGLVDFKKFKTYGAAILVCLIVYLFSYDFISGVIDSFIHSDSAGGSNSDMREGQLEFCLYWLSQSPIYGNGIAYLGSIMEYYVTEIYGAESIWFFLMVDQGILGCLAFASYIAVPVINAIKRHYKVVVFMALGFLFAKTASSIPGIPISYYMMMTIILLKLPNIITDEND